MSKIEGTDEITLYANKIIVSGLYVKIILKARFINSVAVSFGSLIDTKITLKKTNNLDQSQDSTF